MERDLATTLHQVRAAKAGDRGVLEELLTRYLPIVRRLVALRLGRTERQSADIEELVQDALLAAFKSIDQFQEQSEGTFRDWMAKIVENRIRDRARYEGREKRAADRVVMLDSSSREPGGSPAVAPAAPTPTPSSDARHRELEEARQQALLKLDERYREVILLREECGMSYEEIAPRFGFRQEGPVRALYSRAIAKLRALLEDHR